MQVPPGAPAQVSRWRAEPRGMGRFEVERQTIFEHRDRGRDRRRVLAAVLVILTDLGLGAVLVVTLVAWLAGVLAATLLAS